MRTRDPYVVELAQTVNKMFAAGETNPSADEIAEKHFSGMALGGEILDGVAKRLGKIRDVLQTDFNHSVCLLSGTYFTVHKNGDPPTTEAEARRCIPGGYKIPAVGIHLQKGDDDLIYQAMLGMNLASGAGKTKKSVDLTLEAVEDHSITEPRAARILDRARRKAAPKKPALQKRVMTKLGRKK